MPGKSHTTIKNAADRRLQKGFLRWYDKSHRLLPWRVQGRGKPNPYHILVSEAMLQQTQVVTVIGYFNRFIEHFPTIQSLAGADEQAVLRLWQGLGYYRRARNLHRAAQMIMESYGGEVPALVDELIQLPGVGAYTAGAIASIAYDQPAAILDGNVARVLARLFALTDPIDRSDTKNELWSLARRLVPDKRPGDFNQAMMELGATVCTPREPACDVCPVRSHCRAASLGLTRQLPKVLPRKPPAAVVHHVLVVRKGNKFVFEQRPEKGLWSKMWQLPTKEESIHRKSRGAGSNMADDAATLSDWFKTRTGVSMKSLKKLDSFGHQTTHRLIEFVVWSADAELGRLSKKKGVWRKLDQLEDLPMANPQHRVVKIMLGTLTENERNRRSRRDSIPTQSR